MHEDLIDIRNKLETVEDKIDALARALAKIARRLADDSSDEKKVKSLTAELSTVATELESAVAANKP